MTDNGDKVAGGWGKRLNLPYKKLDDKNVIRPKIILPITKEVNDVVKIHKIALPLGFYKYFYFTFIYNFFLHKNL